MDLQVINKLEKDVFCTFKMFAEDNNAKLKVELKILNGIQDEKSELESLHYRLDANATWNSEKSFTISLKNVHIIPVCDNLVLSIESYTGKDIYLAVLNSQV